MPRVFDLIKPLDNRDTYAITDVAFQKGGLREVTDLTAMYAISTERRRIGMITFIIETGEFYSLTGGDLTNNSWEKIDFAPNVIGNISSKEYTVTPSENSESLSAGENLSINVLDTSIVRVYNGASIAALSDSNVHDGKLLFLQNLSGNTIIIKNDYLKTLNTFTNFVNTFSGLRQIAFNGDNNIYIMTSQDGELLKSNDLETWESINDIDSNTWVSITQGGSTFIAVSSDGTNRVVFSSDGGTTWTHVAVELHDWQSITHKDGLFVAVATGKAMYSVDGLEWTYIDLPNKTWKHVAYGKETFVAIAETLDGVDDIIYSIDNGITWQTAIKPNTNLMNKVRFIDDHFYIITNQDILVSTDGVTYTVFSFPYDSTEIQEIIYNNYFFIFIKKQIAYYTDDFTNWREYEFINTNTYYDFTIKNEKYYLIYDNGIDELVIEDISDNKYSIYTGTNLELLMLKNSSFVLQFSEVEDVWRVIGGVSLNPTLLSLLDVPDAYPTVPENNNVFLLVNPDEESEDRVVFDNPFPVTLSNTNLVIDQINGLRIRRFDSTTGEIVFAKFTPTYNMTVTQSINFDDQITSITNISITNDTFIPTIKLNTINDIVYYNNNDINTTFPLAALSLSPGLPVINNSYTWTEAFTFNAIPDINTDFIDSPSSFTIKATLVDTVSNIYNIQKAITYKSPNFSFITDEKTVDFRQPINSTDLTFEYTNITSKDDNSEIISITSDIVNGPNFSGFTNGMLTYAATSLGVNAEALTKSNNLIDTYDYTFTAICRYTRPIEIDSDENYNDISVDSMFTVNFTYPIFTGVTAITTTSLTASQVETDLIDRGNAVLPRTFTQVVSNDNQHWWFAIRKRYVNGETPKIKLDVDGFIMPTVILGSNDVEITTPGGSETYTCYYIVLQANNTYSINISI